MPRKSKSRKNAAIKALKMNVVKHQRRAKKIKSENSFQNIDNNETTAESAETQLNISEDLNDNCNLQTPSTSQEEMSTWTEEETLELINLYKSYPHLWNKNSDLYQNKLAKESALLSIMSKMGPDKFKSVREVKIKLNNLRGIYQRVLKKKARLETEGFPYQPTLRWFNEFREIMDADRLEPVKQEPDSDEHFLVYSEPTSTSNATTSECIETIPDEENSLYVERQFTPQATFNVAPIPLKRKINDKDSAGPSRHDMSRQEKEIVNDEFHMFANNIEEQLLRKRQEPLVKNVMPKWTEEETFELVKLYKSYPHLWNRNSDLYRNKEAREGAFLSIMSKMGPDKFKSAQDVKFKLNSLRMRCHQDLRKKANLKKKGSRCRPKLKWFNDFREIIDANRVEQVPDSDNCDKIVIEYNEPTSTSNEITSVFLETMPDEENTLNVESQLTSQATINVDPIPLKRIKLEEHDEDNAGLSHDMSRQETVYDEFQMFANNIAEQLRKLPLDRALKIQLEIQSTVTKERTQFYRKYTRKEHK